MLGAQRDDAVEARRLGRALAAVQAHGDDLGVLDQPVAEQAGRRVVVVLEDEDQTHRRLRERSSRKPAVDEVDR